MSSFNWIIIAVLLIISEYGIISADDEAGVVAGVTGTGGRKVPRKKSWDKWSKSRDDDDDDSRRQIKKLYKKIKDETCSAEECAQLQQEIKDNEENIHKNKKLIMKNAGNILDGVDALGALAGRVAKNEGDINKLHKKVWANKKAIADNRRDIEKNAARIEWNTQAIWALKKKVLYLAKKCRKGWGKYRKRGGSNGVTGSETADGEEPEIAETTEEIEGFPEESTLSDVADIVSDIADITAEEPESETAETSGTA